MMTVLHVNCARSVGVWVSSEEPHCTLLKRCVFLMEGAAFAAVVQPGIALLTHSQQ